MTKNRAGSAAAEGKDVSSTLINNETIVDFMDNYTRFLSFKTDKLSKANGDKVPQIRITRMDSLDRSSGSRAGILEEQENFTAEISFGINIALVCWLVWTLTDI